MSNYYQIRISSTDKDRCVFGTPAVDGRPINPWIFSEGKPWQNTGRLTVDLYKRGNILNLNMQGHGIWFAKPDVAKTLQKLAKPGELELVPCIGPGQILMMILNPLFPVECLDVNRSRNVTYFRDDDPGMRVGIQHITQIAMIPSSAEGRHIFRIKGYMLPIVVSDIIRQYLTPPDAFGVALSALLETVESEQLK